MADLLKIQELLEKAQAATARAKSEMKKAEEARRRAKAKEEAAIAAWAREDERILRLAQTAQSQWSKEEKGKAIEAQQRAELAQEFVGKINAFLAVSYRHGLLLDEKSRAAEEVRALKEASKTAVKLLAESKRIEVVGHQAAGFKGAAVKLAQELVAETVADLSEARGRLKSADYKADEFRHWELRDAAEKLRTIPGLGRLDAEDPDIRRVSKIKEMILNGSYWSKIYETSGRKVKLYRKLRKINKEFKGAYTIGQVAPELKDLLK